MFSYRLLWQSWKHSLLCVSLYTCECVHTLCNICLTSFLHCYNLEKTFCCNSITWCQFKLLSRIAYLFSFFYNDLQDPADLVLFMVCLMKAQLGKLTKCFHIHAGHVGTSSTDDDGLFFFFFFNQMIWHTFWAVIGWSVCNAVCGGVTHMYSKNTPDDSQKMCRELN